MQAIKILNGKQVKIIQKTEEKEFICYGVRKEKGTAQGEKD